MKTTAEMIAVMQAYADGKKMEYKGVEGAPYDWEECPDPLWNWVLCDYRIKPEPKYRPYANADECFADVRKHGGWVKEKKREVYYNVGAVLFRSVGYYEGSVEDFDEFLEENVWADDGSVCGVLEEE